ncbi:MAG: DUF4199 domain-containing protein [Bacteroidetes bacterium]|nr:DUF4199 domain-containing protein [Bacteroidota bacterium]
MQLYLKWAVFVAAAGILIRLIMFFAGISIDPSMQWVQWIGTVIGLALVFLGVRERKMQDPSAFTFGTGWVTAFMICLLAGVISALWVFVDASFIETDMIDNARKMQEAAMIAQKMPADQMKQAKPMMDFFISPSGFAISTVFMYLIGGALVGLLIAPIVKAIGGNAGAEPQTPTAAGM